MEGTVKWFNNSKGYGFITSDDGVDIFVHQTEIAMEGFRTLEPDDRVSFEIRQSPKGPQATNVVKIQRR